MTFSHVLYLFVEARFTVLAYNIKAFMVAQISLDTITGCEYGFESLVVIFILGPIDFKWFIVIPIKAEKSPLWVFSYLFQLKGRILCNRVKFCIVLVVADMIRQLVLVGLAVLPTEDSKHPSDILRVILQLLWQDIVLNCKGYTHVQFV